MAEIVELDSLDKLEDLMTRSADSPVLIIKHSATCGISAGVYNRLNNLDAEINLVTVQYNRDVSNAIEEQTGVRHQSPQALILRNGEVVYSASHYSITPEALATELKNNQ